MANDKKRITELTEATTVKSDHYIPVDHGADGTQKMKMTTLMDTTLTSSGKAADAQATGNAIAAEATARSAADYNLADEIDVERNRITNLATLTEGSTTGDAELIDIRVGVDGTTYENAGSAVRGQISAVKADLLKYGAYIGGDNLYNPATDSDALLNSSGGAVANSKWSTTDFIPVDGNETICFQGDIIKTGTLNAVYYACYNESKTTVQNRQSITITAGSDYWTFTVPSCKYIRVSFLKGQFANIMVSESSTKQDYTPYLVLKPDIADITNISRNCFYAKLENDILYVRSMYGATNDIIVKFGKHNANNLPDFWELSTIPNSLPYVVESLDSIVGFLSVSTDWHGPFIVKAVNNADGDNTGNDIFTGGNHLYNNLATARCTSLDYYVNGRKATSFEGLINHLEIRWTNMVQASNTVKSDGTGREVLKETHRMIFDGMTWTSWVDVEALEDINIVTYYGFQISGVNSVFPNFRFIGGTSLKEYTNASAHDSGGKMASTIITHGTSHKAEIGLDCSYGMGKRDYYDGTKGAFSTANGNKLYFWLIQNNTFEDGDIISAKADYIFSPV